MYAPMTSRSPAVILLRISAFKNSPNVQHPALENTRDFLLSDENSAFEYEQRERCTQLVVTDLTEPVA